MLESYHPWGKPGNGAPMPGALRKTKWIVEETPAVEHTVSFDFFFFGGGEV